MNIYKKGHFLNKLLFYYFTTLFCTLFCSYPFWFPQVRLVMNHFVFVLIPNFKSFFFTPKCLFIVGNAIVAILVLESKLTTSSHSFPASNIYDEYVERSQSLHKASKNKKEKKQGKKADTSLTKDSVNNDEEIKHVVYVEKEKSEIGDTNVANEDDYKKRDDEEEPGLPAEELNKRVEEFIAKVNKQMWLEEKGLIII